MKPLDAFATEQHFVDHVAAVWAQLPAAARGRFVVPEKLVERARAAGVERPVMQIPRGARRPVVVASYGDLKRVRRAGRERIALMEHGMGQSYSGDQPSYAGGRDRDDVSLFLVPNRHAAKRNQARNPDATVVITGCPKLDQLPRREEGGERPTLALSFHWNGDTREAKSAFRHFRTALPLLARKYKVLGHGHPRMQGIIWRLYESRGIEVVRDFEEVCRRADLYICDGVSTLYEFASTGRPVVVLNAPWYRKHTEHGLRYWRAATVGVQCDSPLRLLSAVELALSDPPGQQAAREAALDVVYAYRSGAAKRAATALTRWAA